MKEVHPSISPDQSRGLLNTCNGNPYGSYAGFGGMIGNGFGGFGNPMIGAGYSPGFVGGMIGPGFGGGFGGGGGIYVPGYGGGQFGFGGG